MHFEPIAIVGQGAVLPDARTPDAFWDNVKHGRDSLRRAPANRWRLCHEPEQTWHDIGGYVEDTAANPQFEWMLDAVRQALPDHAGRIGLVAGNLSFPTAGLADYAERVWRGTRRTDPRDRFSSGLPVHRVAEELGLSDGFAIDAACASSLYAIKLACDRLHDRTADVMIAGAVNCADDLFIHTGFTALQALSPTGRSRPFHREADGLVPAEGAAFVGLMRLEDVGDREVFGVIRGVGLSNDGRGSGLLVPSAEGQERAMAQAYAMAGVTPETVSLLECHATGTPVGDAVEVHSTSRIFRDHKGLPIGSAKSNVGHLITAAGAAGLLKVLGAMRDNVLPATLHADDVIDELGGTPLRVLREAEKWTGRKRAAVSAFGFGGNNAHLIVDALCSTTGAVTPLPRKEPVAIVAVAARVGDQDDLRHALFAGKKPGRRESIDVDLDGLRMPPLDLKYTLGQHLLLLDAAREAVRGQDLPRERTTVLIGMGCDPEVARYGARWRAAPEERDGVIHPLTSSGVVGTMPNITANRLSSVLDLAGPGFAVSAEEQSGVVALQIAARALRTCEVDAAVVGAVDLSDEPVHRQALADLGINRESGDAAVVLVLKRLNDVEDDQVIAVLDDNKSGGGPSTHGFGVAHAAKGLLDVAVAALSLRHRAVPRDGAPADPAFDIDAAEVTVEALGAPARTVRLRKHRTAAFVTEPAPRLRVYSGSDRSDVLRNLEAGRETESGPARLVTVGDREEAASKWLTLGGPKPEGVAFQAKPIDGEIAFVFTGGLAAYPGMGRELLLAFPHVLEEIERRSGSVAKVAGWAYRGTDSAPGEVLDQIWGTALLSQVHAAVSREVLGLRPRAALGYSAGESNALVALGVWTDMRDLVRDMTASGMFATKVAGEFAAIRAYWRRHGIAATEWKNYLVGTDPEHARKLLDGEPAAHLIAVNSPWSCVIGGDKAACERVLSMLDTAYALPMPYELAVHTPELTEVRDEWWRLHHRPVTPPQGVRFYSCATDEPYLPTSERIAHALTAQAVGTMDFARTIDKAWRDGVRVFVEHGPKALCSDWIRQTLGTRDHLAVALDAGDGRGTRQISRVAAELVAAGVDIDRNRLHTLLGEQPAPDRGRVITLPAHPPEVRLSSETRKMVRPPELPAVLVANALAHESDLPGPKFDRADLELLASGQISKLFGPLFSVQDGHARQCRMPMPPMLLADRVTGIDAEPGSMGQGTIWTETDVTEGAWYLDHTGRMPAGIMIEAGQADLLLISWLGVDMLNAGERVYRLLGCELTYHGSPAVPGETLRYEINIGGHAELDGVRLFFFHYDCYVGDELRLSVRKGQAGFFTDAELAATTGVIWDPATLTRGRLDPPVTKPARSYDQAAVHAFAEGRTADCFGPEWDLTRSHTRTPRIAGEQMLFLGEIVDFDIDRGYLKATSGINPDDWYFDGHFKNDPCMPGTLMFEGCLQAMSFYLAGCGFTIANDAWRFEPVDDVPYEMRCRGQVTPQSRRIDYEVFVTELHAGPIPTLFADVLCTVDGVKAFHAKHVGLRLVPDWPLGDITVSDPRAASAGVVTFDYRSLLACAWGRPTEAFGPLYERFDGHRRVARLPGPPYHFMTRITEITGGLGTMTTGSTCVAEYDVPPDAWYFEQNHGTMPLSVLMEVVLQPCGWLASYVGCAVEIDEDLLFRNLDGKGTIHRPVTPQVGKLRTEVVLRDISVNGPMIIVSFELKCFGSGDELIYDLHTVFGFFPREAFIDQPGLPSTPQERQAICGSGVVVDLTTSPEKYCGGPLRLAGSSLLMIDRITGYDPVGGTAGLGRVVAEKDVDPGEWFFRAHFFQDPVQPGSLGIEALYQVLQFHLIEQGAGDGLAAPRFEMEMDTDPLVWKYRGQVVPSHRVITSEVEITAYDPVQRRATAKAWLWVDGKRIYSAAGLSVRVVDDSVPGDEDWLMDHRPTWTVPVLPMMSVMDQMAGESGAKALRDVEMRRWITADPLPRLRTRVDGDGVTLLAWREAGVPALSRFEPVATGSIAESGLRPAPFPALEGAQDVIDFYSSGALFHGPAFQYLKALRRSTGGASGVLDAAAGSVPYGTLHQGLLDAATHVVPHDSLWLWHPAIPLGHVAYPHRISHVEMFEPLPTAGEVGVEARFGGFDDVDQRFPVVHLQLVRDGRVLVAMRLVEILMPTGAFSRSTAEQRRTFLRDREYSDGLGVSTTRAGTTTVTRDAVHACDWLVGTIAQTYGLPRGARGTDYLRHIAVCDHVGRLARVHPSAVSVDGTTAVACGQTYQLRVNERDDVVVVTS